MPGKVIERVTQIAFSQTRVARYSVEVPLTIIFGYYSVKPIDGSPSHQLSYPHSEVLLVDRKKFGSARSCGYTTKYTIWNGRRSFTNIA